MNATTDPADRPADGRTLLTRLLDKPQLGALLKGVGIFLRDYSTGEAVPNTLWRELGYSASDMRGERWHKFIHSDDISGVKEFHFRLMSGAADAWEGEYRIRSRAGEYRNIRHKALILERTSEGVPSLYVGWDVDVTEERARIAAAVEERDRNERRLQRSEAIRTAGAILSADLDPVRAADRVLAQAVRVLPFDEASIWTIDGDRLLRLAARGYSTADGGRRKTISKTDLKSLLEMRSPRITDHPFATFPSRMEIPLLIWGELHGILAFRSLRPQAFGPEEVASALEFSDHAVIAIANALRFREAEIEASTDWLTGLPTRRAFMSRLGRLKEELPPTALVSALMIDLDKFKWVNDTYGHSVGDAVLSAITSICKDSLRANDLCCRFGGEEILAVLPYADGGTAMGVAERLRQRVAHFRFRENPEIQLTVSIGIHTDTGDVDYRRMVELADEALYMAKSAGRNRCEAR